MDAADIVHVHQLLGLYGHIVDAGRWDRFDELFVPDAELDYTAVRAPRVFHGVDEIRGYFEAGNHPSAHHVVNIVVWEEDGEVKTPEGWRVQRRVCTPRWQFTSGDTGQEIPEDRRTW